MANNFDWNTILSSDPLVLAAVDVVVEPVTGFFAKLGCVLEIILVVSIFFAGV
jgi:hypothetical protein